MGLCILEGRKSKEIKSGEALLLTIGSTGAQFYWSYDGTFYTDGFMQFKNLDFSDVRNGFCGSNISSERVTALRYKMIIPV